MRTSVLVNLQLLCKPRKGRILRLQLDASSEVGRAAASCGSVVKSSPVTKVGADGRMTILLSLEGRTVTMCFMGGTQVNVRLVASAYTKLTMK